MRPDRIKSVYVPTNFNFFVRSIYMYTTPMSFRVRPTGDNLWCIYKCPLLLMHTLFTSFIVYRHARPRGYICCPACFIPTKSRGTSTLLRLLVIFHHFIIINFRANSTPANSKYVTLGAQQLSSNQRGGDYRWKLHH